jgi:hypothetical protein
MNQIRKNLIETLTEKTIEPGKKVCPSRYGDDRQLFIMSDTFLVLWGKSRYMRFANPEDQNADGLGMIDFEGGPCLFLGSDFIEDKNYGKIIYMDSLNIPNEDNIAYVVIEVEPSTK